MKIRYNAPVILSLSLIAIAILILDAFWVNSLTRNFFTATPHFSLSVPLDYFRLISYVLGHANLNHLIGNLVFLLPLGSILEEKYGSGLMLSMVIVTAFATSVINGLLFSTGIIGASGIVFMLIMLSSLTNFCKGEIPLTFILIAILFLIREAPLMLQANNISHFGHMAGGTIGGLFGFLLAKEK